MIEQTNISILNTFTIDSLPDLDIAVLGALENFSKEPIPNIDLQKMYDKPLVVGSGNAEATGRIIFQNNDSLFASESTFEGMLKHIKNIDGVVVISASGGKHAPGIVKIAKQYGKKVTLITNTPNSPASMELDRTYEHAEYVFPKNREPYTYNTSTYLGIILGYTKENPDTIYNFIQTKIAPIKYPNLSKYNKFYLIVPTKFSGIIRMLQIKFIELFGRQIARDIETAESIKHATTVVQSDELFISFGEPNEIWGKPTNRLHIPLPDGADYGAMMAIGYYIIAQIQKQHPPYFKQHIVEYTKYISKIFGTNIEPIVS